MDTTSALVYSTRTPQPKPKPLPQVTYVICRVCGYERPVGTGCGLPCV